MKTLLTNFLSLILRGEVWIENCQLKPKANFEEEIWVERLFLDFSKEVVFVQFREIDQTDAPRFSDRIDNLFTQEQIKFLYEIARNPPEYKVEIKGNGTKADIIKSLEDILDEVKRSDIADYEVGSVALYTIIEKKGEDED